MNSPRFAAIALAAYAVLGLTACAPEPDGVRQSAAYTEVPDDSAAADGSTDDPASDPAAGPSTDGAATSAPADPGKTEDCLLIGAAIAESSASGDDPARMVDAMKSAAQQLADATPQVEDPELAASAAALQTGFSDAAGVMAALFAGDTSKAEQMSQVDATMSEALEQFEALCEL